jgi:hypothetical protein
VKQISASPEARGEDALGNLLVVGARVVDRLGRVLVELCDLVDAVLHAGRCLTGLASFDVQVECVRGAGGAPRPARPRRRAEYFFIFPLGRLISVGSHMAGRTKSGHAQSKAGRRDG